MSETITLGRARRSTAGNRMRELLEKAHQQDEEDIFAEEEGDEEFAAPDDVRDVFLDEFADTDEEVDDEDAEEREIRLEERRRAKGKSKAIYNPYATASAKPKRPVDVAAVDPSSPSSSTGEALLAAGLDPSNMAPTTLVLEMRKQRREQKRLHRSEARRSTMRASTLRTEDEIREREEQAKLNPSRKGRKALHEGGEVRGQRNMTQAELIAEALEEEERNKEELRKWLRREEEKRELRRVGRKRVRGPRWTWISRTVGKAVEVVGEGAGQGNAPRVDVQPDQEPTPAPATPATPPAQTANDTTITADTTDSANGKANTPEETAPKRDTPSLSAPAPIGDSEVALAGPSRIPDSRPIPVTSFPTASTPQSDAPYTRNYLILSQIPGGLPAELSLVLGDHIEWDQMQYIPARNRPINRRPPLCPFTGLVAKYRHPSTMIPYATVEGYKLIEAMLRERYVWSESGFWLGGEEDAAADGIEGVKGWAEAVHGGWMGGFEIPRSEEQEEQVAEVEEVEMDKAEEPEPSPVSEKKRVSGKKGKRKSEAVKEEPNIAAQRKRTKSASVVVSHDQVAPSPVSINKGSKAKRKSSTVHIV